MFKFSIDLNLLFSKTAQIGLEAHPRFCWEFENLCEVYLKVKYFEPFKSLSTDKCQKPQ